MVRYSLSCRSLCAIQKTSWGIQVKNTKNTNKNWPMQRVKARVNWCKVILGCIALLAFSNAYAYEIIFSVTVVASGNHWQPKLAGVRLFVIFRQVALNMQLFIIKTHRLMPPFVLKHAEVIYKCLCCQ